MQDIFSYNQVIIELREFFQKEKKYVEVPAQSRLSILAACEDPKNITSFSFDKIDYPLPQTGQMWLERELLNNPNLPGVFCISTSYRNEPNPVAGRHDKIFPMFEFEGPGDIEALRQIEAELLEYLGFPMVVSKNYNDLLKYYNVDELGYNEEEAMCQEFSRAVSLENFPASTSPFWNMKEGKDKIFKKIDIILHGVETIGSAERETDVDRMRENFYTISNGEYANLLFANFGKERVEEELREYFSLPMFPRFGGGIGVTRMARALTLESKIKGYMPNLAVDYQQEGAVV